MEKEKEEKVKTERIVSKSNIVWLSEVGKGDANIVGGKGAHLAEMYNLELPVPSAFIVTVQAFVSFLEEAGLKKKIKELLSGIDLRNTLELEGRAKAIQKLIVEAEIPARIKDQIVKAYSRIDFDEETFEPAGKEIAGLMKASHEPAFVAVRSSSTAEDLSSASFAGQLESFLNIKGDKKLLEAVKKCWASLFTARVIFYRQSRGFEHEKALIAVIVEKMINADKAGVTFTVNPITNENDIVTEAVFGLGQGVVSGSIEPDTYVVNKETLHIKDRKIGKKEIYFTRSRVGETITLKLPEEKINEQVLLGSEIRTLSQYAKRIEEHFGSPQDIEWAIERNNIYILQSRPVTTLGKEIRKKEEEEKPKEKEPILSGLAASQGFATGTVKIVSEMKDLVKIRRGDILVTKMTNPDMVVTMQKASAIVTDEGGLTAHAAIVSREVGLPCVVGTKKATQALKDGQLISVDGTNGKIYEAEEVEAIEEKETGEEGEVEEEGKAETEEEELFAEPVAELKEVRKEVREAGEEEKEEEEIEEEEVKEEEEQEETRTKVKVICDLPSVAERAASTKADGVGLLRIEFIIAESGIHPAEYIRRGQAEQYTKVLVEGIGKIARAFKGKPIWIRTSDLRSDEYRNLEGAEFEPHEANPMLGWHGIRRALDEPEILRAELLAIKKLKEEYNIAVMLPFLINVDEIGKVKDLIKEIGLETELGVMIETPASCMIIEDLCTEGIDFISFGTNDLTQLTLGIDRNNERIAKLYDEMHPAMLHEISKVIETCKRYGVKTSICGQAGSRPETVAFLVKQGIDSISANIDAVKSVRKIVAKVERELSGS